MKLFPRFEAYLLRVLVLPDVERRRLERLPRLARDLEARPLEGDRPVSVG